MERRNVFKSLILAAAGGASLLATRKSVAAPLPVTVSKVVYHLDDMEKVAFVLERNMSQHLTGMGGSENVKLSLVVLGPALAAFKWPSANASVAGTFAELVKDGVEMNACSNTMKAMHLTLKDLLPGFIEATKGGNVRIVELQAQGYAYLRP